MSYIPTLKYSPNDPVFIVDNLGWVIEPATIKDICCKYPGYYLVKTDRGAEITLGENQIFSTKKEAVLEILTRLKNSIAASEARTAKLKGILSEYESANFQMRYMGEVIE